MSYSKKKKNGSTLFFKCLFLLLQKCSSLLFAYEKSYGVKAMKEMEEEEGKEDEDSGHRNGTSFLIHMGQNRTL